MYHLLLFRPIKYKFLKNKEGGTTGLYGMKK